MIPLDYLVLRLARRAAPQPVVDFLLDRGMYLKPGRDTSEPERVARIYVQRALAHGLDVTGKTVCVVGYGGGFGGSRRSCAPATCPAVGPTRRGS